MKQRTGKYLLSVLLALAMVVGLLPGVGLTAYAASHNITINNTQHGTVTASVNGSAVTSADEGTIVTLTANPEDGYRLKSISGTYKDYSSERLVCLHLRSTDCTPRLIIEDVAMKNIRLPTALYSHQLSTAVHKSR